jgi:ATP-dependent Clp protease ATP-binding subunit ClpA
MGARPMARLIQEQLKKPLANELLFGELAKGGAAKVVVKKDKLAINYESKKELVEH